MCRVILLLGWILFFASCKQYRTDAAAVTSKEIGEIVFDLDNNGVTDSFKCVKTENGDTLVFIYNHRAFFYPASSVEFISFEEQGFLNKNIISDSFFVLTPTQNQTLLLVKDKGDFAGPVLNVFVPKKDSIARFILNNYSYLIGLEDMNKDGINEILLHTSYSEPGGGDSLLIHNFTRYLVYKYINGEILFDTSLTNNYNQLFTPYYKEYLSAKQPGILFFAAHLNRTDSFVVDLDTIKF